MSKVISTYVVPNGTMLLYADGHTEFVPFAAAKTGASGGGGSAAATPAASPAAAAPVAPPTPTVEPFFTPDDLLNINAYQGTYDDSEAGIKRGLADLETDTGAQLAANDKSAVKNTDAAQENAAARGIFRSSIKDANVYDIEAQRRINKQLLDDHLTTARLDASSRLGKLADRQRDFNKALAAKQVQNAQAITPVVPEPPSAAPASPAAPAAPAAAPMANAPYNFLAHGKDVVSSVPGRDSHGNPGKWNTHADGTKVFVRA